MSIISFFHRASEFIDRLRCHCWWLLPAATAIAYASAARTVSGIAITTGVTALLELFLVRTFLRSRTERLVGSLLLVLCVLLFGGVLLFLERIIFKLPLIALTASVFAFVHYAMHSSALHPDTDARAVMQEGFRLIAGVSIFYVGVLYFAVIFYFGIANALLGAPLLLLPFTLTILSMWFEQLSLRERLTHAVSLEIILLEAIAVLMILPVSYGISALVLLIIHFLYGVYILNHHVETTGPHHNDRTLALLVVGIVVLLGMLITQWR